MVSGCTYTMSDFTEQKWFSEHTHLKMSWIQHQIHQKNSLFSPSSSPFTVTLKDSTPSSSSSSSSSGSRISPAVLFVIVILAVLFVISGLLHFLLRYIIKHPSSSTSSQSNRYPDGSTSDALQRQLQQLFHLHDSGLDQAFIDALPVFMYKEIVGLKEPFDCAVCLCEFSKTDKLRLLPSCSHAFHLSCIDTWLLSNSSCPLCRGTLFSPGFPIENPMFDFDDPMEEDGFSGHGGNGFPSYQKNIEIEETVVRKGVLPVRLGKFKKLNQGAREAVGETSSSNLDARRCYSMGSYQYLEGDTRLRVAFNREENDREVKHVKGMERNQKHIIDGDVEGKKISIGTKTDSYSVSKIWQWPKSGEFASLSVTHSNHPPLNVNPQWMGRRQGL
ncbi:hypothetical protein LguiA_017093 [Lonicera macranthoides]